MMTQSGNQVLPTNDVAPTLDDIALGLSRAPRFAGQSLVPWSVAEHSMVVALLARPLGAAMELHGLLHDAHEAVTGDVPSSWKPPELRALQKGLDARIYRALGVVRPSPEEAVQVKLLDLQALVVEAKWVAVPRAYLAIRAEVGWGSPTSDADAAFGEVWALDFSPASAAAYYVGWVSRLRACL